VNGRTFWTWSEIAALVSLLVGAMSIAACESEVSEGLGLETQAPTNTGYGSPASANDAGADEDAADAPRPTVDTVAVLESVARGAYLTSPAFRQVTEAPYPSAAAPGSRVSEWVSTASWYQYIAISPGVTGSQVTLPVGTTIVRTVLDADGGVGKVTLMFKGPAGYNPALGDWWFAVTDTDGLPLESDGGAQCGKLTECFSCHIPRSNDGYLFGVPLDDRVPAATDNP
jgi:hypothetical protein